MPGRRVIRMNLHRKTGLQRSLFRHERTAVRSNRGGGRGLMARFPEAEARMLHRKICMKCATPATQCGPSVAASAATRACDPRTWSAADPDPFASDQGCEEQPCHISEQQGGHARRPQDDEQRHFSRDPYTVHLKVGKGCNGLVEGLLACVGRGALTRCTTFGPVKPNLRHA